MNANFIWARRVDKVRMTIVDFDNRCAKRSADGNGLRFCKIVNEFAFGRVYNEH